MPSLNNNALPQMPHIKLIFGCIGGVALIAVVAIVFLLWKGIRKLAAMWRERSTAQVLKVDVEATKSLPIVVELPFPEAAAQPRVHSKLKNTARLAKCLPSRPVLPLDRPDVAQKMQMIMEFAPQYESSPPRRPSARRVYPQIPEYASPSLDPSSCSSHAHVPRGVSEPPVSVFHPQFESSPPRRSSRPRVPPMVPPPKAYDVDEDCLPLAVLLNSKRHLGTPRKPTLAPFQKYHPVKPVSKSMKENGPSCIPPKIKSPLPAGSFLRTQSTRAPPRLR